MTSARILPISRGTLNVAKHSSTSTRSQNTLAWVTWTATLNNLSEGAAVNAAGFLITSAEKVPLRILHSIETHHRSNSPFRNPAQTEDSVSVFSHSHFALGTCEVPMNYRHLQTVCTNF